MDIQLARVLARGPPSSRILGWSDARAVGFGGAAAGGGRDRTTIRVSFSSVTVRRSTERRRQPSAASPTRSLTEPLVASSRTSAISRGLPIAVPCSVKGGRSGSGGGGDLAIEAGGAGAGGGAAGRRDAEKSGRSRVAESELRGIPHRGLPCGGGCPSPGFSGVRSRGSAVSPVSCEPPAPAECWARATHVEKQVIAAMTQAQPLIILPTAAALVQDYGIRTSWTARAPYSPGEKVAARERGRTRVAPRGVRPRKCNSCANLPLEAAAEGRSRNDALRRKPSSGGLSPATFSPREKEGVRRPTLNSMKKSHDSDLSDFRRVQDGAFSPAVISCLRPVGRSFGHGLAP
jgi:hypothetical protein